MIKQYSEGVALNIHQSLESKPYNEERFSMFRLSIALCFAAARSAILANTALSFSPSSPFAVSLSALSLIVEGSCHTLSPFLPESTIASDFEVRGKIPAIAPKFTPASSRLADLPCIIGVGLFTVTE